MGVRSRDALRDSHRWRKYGEKKIGKGERIRKSYYTCAHVKNYMVSVAEPNEIDVVCKGTHELRPVLRSVDSGRKDALDHGFL